MFAWCIKCMSEFIALFTPSARTNKVLPWRKKIAEGSHKINQEWEKEKFYCRFLWAVQTSWRSNENKIKKWRRNFHTRRVFPLVVIVRLLVGWLSTGKFRKSFGDLPELFHDIFRQTSRHESCNIYETFLRWRERDRFIIYAMDTFWA